MLDLGANLDYYIHSANFEKGHNGQLNWVGNPETA